MPLYYNRARGPLPLRLLSGVSVSVPGKGWINVEPRDEGSPDVLRYKLSGDLVMKVAAIAPAPQLSTTERSADTLTIAESVATDNLVTSKSSSPLETSPLRDVENEQAGHRS